MFRAVRGAGDVDVCNKVGIGEEGPRVVDVAAAALSRHTWAHADGDPSNTSKWGKRRCTACAFLPRLMVSACDAGGDKGRKKQGGVGRRRRGGCGAWEGARVPLG